MATKKLAKPANRSKKGKTTTKGAGAKRKSPGKVTTTTKRKAAPPPDQKQNEQPPQPATEAKPTAQEQGKPNGKMTLAAAGLTAAPKKWHNLEVVQLLYQIAAILELQGEIVFKIVSYRRAADSIERLPQNVQDLWAGDPKNLRSVHGVGEAIAQKLDELFRTGRMSYFEKISKDIPPGLFEIMTIPGVGPKTALRLWKELNIADINSLEANARLGKLSKLSGFGPKTEENILAGIEAARRKKSTHRVLLGRALPFAQNIIAALQDACGPDLEQIEVAGSLRRMRPTIGDIDLLAASPNPEVILNAFVRLPQVSEVQEQGSTKASILAQNGLQVDLRVLEPRRWGTAHQYFTGGKEHNVQVRQVALSRGLSLSEWDFKEVKSGKAVMVATEEEVYERLGMQWVPPELREAAGEIEAALEKRLPKLIVLNDLKGDLQSHSTYSDGRATIEQMALAAKARGLRYLALTDHSHGLGVTGGLNLERAQQQWVEIDRLNAGWNDFRIVKAVEAEIRADGSIDLPDEVLAQFELVVASTHVSLNQPRERITERVVRALRNPHVDIFAHPTGRLINERESSALDLEELFKVALETGVMLEINAAPERLDLDDVNARRAHNLGIPIVISSDAHSPGGFDVLPYGIAMARRAWLTAADVANTLDWPEFRQRLRRNKRT